MTRSLTELLAERGFENAAALVLAGRVLVDGVRETRGGVAVRDDVQIEVLPGREYVSRGALKLLGAFEDLFADASAPSDRDRESRPDSSSVAKLAKGPDIAGRICLDLGASHGGFSQVLLERAPARIYAIDVAYGILDFAVRRDQRVVALEKRNARNLAADWLAPDDLALARNDSRERGIFVTGDLSFISIRRILDALARFAGECDMPLEILLLVKPQFEEPDATENGILRDATRREAIVAEVVRYAPELGFRELRTAPSRLPGAKGNVEYFMHAFL